MEIQQHSDGKIKISGSGLDLEISTHYILTETMHKDSRKILSQLIENELINALKTFRDSNENTADIRNKLYSKTVLSEHIKKIAIIERDLVYKLHLDGECIDLDKELQEIRDYAHSVWKYCKEYGYVPMKKVSFDI